MKRPEDSARHVSRTVVINAHQIRKRHGITQTQLAQAIRAQGLPIDHGRLSKIETWAIQGKAISVPSVSVDLLIALSKTLATPTPQLLAQPGMCLSCLGTPPTGFTCNNCRAGADHE